MTGWWKVIKKLKVFLGGTCDKTSKWREELIPNIKTDYFNPFVEHNWTDEDRLKEEEEKNTSDILLYVITKRDSIYSVVEATDDSNKTPCKVILCFYDEFNTFTEGDIKSFKAIEAKVKENGSRVVYSLTEVSNIINALYEKDQKQKILNSMGFSHNISDENLTKTLEDKINNMIQLLPNAKQISDGYHTFYYLYDHRCALFALVTTCMKNVAWKSKNHHIDGDPMFDDMFIVGIDTPFGQVTYHYHLDKWDWFSNIKELPNAPKWDGHTPEQCVVRLKDLAKLQSNY